MKIVISNEELALYKDIQYVKLAHLRSDDGIDVTVTINDIGVLVVQYANGEWWIIPNDPIHDYSFDAIGPYDTSDDAVMMMKLSSTRMVTFF